MKKLVLLAGIVAAVVGMRKIFGKKDEAQVEPYGSNNGYAPQAQ